MSQWFQFDHEAPDESDEREQVLADIAAAEKAAVEACTAIRVAAAKYDGYGESTARHSLTHIATMATVEGNRVFKQADRRAEFRRVP